LLHQEQHLFINRCYFEEKFPETFVPMGKRANTFGEKISLYFVIGTILGARLGHILFYEKLAPYLECPWRILKTWEGGLSSHGAVLGITIAISFFWARYRNRYQINFWMIFDLAVIPAALAGALIRIGNFINQEILGSVTYFPWAVMFGHPVDGASHVPRHPAQLYEALCYLLIFLLMFNRYKNERFENSQGRIFGLFMVLIFTCRFVIEFAKEKQSFLLTDEPFLLMGQILSVPLIIAGLYLWLRRAEKSV
jgi:prolipoprotein diacylglyceryl transferase